MARLAITAETTLSVQVERGKDVLVTATASKPWILQLSDDLMQWHDLGGDFPDAGQRHHITLRMRGLIPSVGRLYFRIIEFE